MQQAIDYEIRWQIEEIEDGRAVQQATVLFDPDTGETRAMRTKEDAADYRYFPDPDLPPLAIAAEWIERVRAEMPELPRAMAERFVRDHGLSDYDAAQLTQSPALADYFERAVAAGAHAQAGEQLDHRRDRAPAERCKTSRSTRRRWRPRSSRALIARISDGTISNNAARQVFDALWTGRGSRKSTRSSRPRA